MVFFLWEVHFCHRGSVFACCYCVQTPLYCPGQFRTKKVAKMWPEVLTSRILVSCQIELSGVSMHYDITTSVPHDPERFPVCLEMELPRNYRGTIFSSVWYNTATRSVQRLTCHYNVIIDTSHRSVRWGFRSSLRVRHD